MIKLDAYIGNNRISISLDSFEHLLNCLDNQKYIQDVNADAADCDYKKIQRETHEI